MTTLQRCSPALQAHGRSLLPLRCDELAGGFLGKTLVHLVYNRGGGTAEPPPLPTHKLSPHDIVALRPVSAAAAGGGGGLADAVAQGVVYRVTETRVVVAVDEVEDAGALEVPLRLDKLANKVRVLHCVRSCRPLLACAALQ